MQSCLFRKTARSVSSTHLMCIRDRHEVGLSAGTWTKLNKGEEVSLSILPVSYTHLDVYKRQALYKVLAQRVFVYGNRTIIL